MPIGDVKLSGVRGGYQDPNLGSGVTTALTRMSNSIDGLADSRLALEKAEYDRQQRIRNFDAQVDLSVLNGEWARQQQDAYNAVGETGWGLANSRDEVLRKQANAFLARLDPALQQEYKPRVEALLQDYVTQAYAQEHKIRYSYEVNQIEKWSNEFGSMIINKDDPMNLDIARGMIDNILATSTLSEADQTQLREAAYATLEGADFQAALAVNAQQQPDERPQDGSDVAAPNLSAGERAFLNVTGFLESTSRYNVVLGGGTFDDYGQHPGTTNTDELGRSTTAAGRYQFIAETWERLATKLGLTDFSPANQDKAALELARIDYNRRKDVSDRDFMEVINNGTDEELLRLKALLAPTWQAFDSKYTSDEDFLRMFRGDKGLAGGGTGGFYSPDIWGDERYSSLTVAEKNRYAAEAASMADGISRDFAARQTERANQLSLSVQAGQEGAARISDLLSQNLITASQASSLFKEADNYLSRVSNASDITVAVATGTALSNTPETHEQLSDYYSLQGITQAIETQQPEGIAGLRQAFQNTGMVGRDMQGTLSTMTKSNDPATAQYGLDAMATLYLASPAAFASNFSEEDVNNTLAYNLLKSYGPVNQPGWAVQQMQQLLTPEGIAAAKALKPVIEEQLESITPDVVLNEFDGFFRRQPELPASPALEAKFLNDYNKLYAQYFPLFRDDGKTRTLVKELMSQQWAPDEVSGSNRMLWLGPSTAAAGYVGRDFKDVEEVKTEIYRMMDWPESQEFSIDTDRQTWAEIQRGEAGSFKLIVNDEFGVPRYVTDEFGVEPVRLRPEPSLMLRRQRELETTLEETDARLRSMQERIALLTLPAGGTFPQTETAQAKNTANAAELQQLISARDALKQERDANRALLDEVKNGTLPNLEGLN